MLHSDILAVLGGFQPERKQGHSKQKKKKRKNLLINRYTVLFLWNKGILILRMLPTE